MSEVNLEWSRELNRIQAEFGKRGQFGGSDCFFAGLRVFSDILVTKVDVFLAEIAAKIEVRGRDWVWAHDLVADHVASDFDGVPILAAQKLYVGDAAHLSLLEFTRGLTNAKSHIERHRIGWSAPPPKPWPERNKIAFAMIAAVAGLAAGAVVNEYAPDVLASIFGEHGKTPAAIESPTRQGDAALKANPTTK